MISSALQKNLPFTPSGAIKFGNVGDPTSEISQILHEKKYIRLLEEFNTKPNVYYYNTGD